MKKISSTFALLAAACCILPCLAGCGDKDATKTVPTGEIPAGGAGGVATGQDGGGKKDSGATAPTQPIAPPAGTQTGNFQGGQK